MNLRKLFLLTLFFLLFIGCKYVKTQKKEAESMGIRATSKPSFRLPDIPATLTSPADRTEYLITRYWSGFDFADTALVRNARITEQAFVDFIDLLPHTTEQIATSGITKMMRGAATDSLMFDYFMELTEKYLYDPNSPFRNEGYYIAVLRNVIANEKLSDTKKIRPQYQLNMALKNRVGEKAIDFTFTTQNNKTIKLYNIFGDPLLLFFFYPDCQTCTSVKKYMIDHGIDKQAKVVFINPDIDKHLHKLYDLRASPTLYLLDGNKKVVLKDASIEEIEHYLARR